MKPNIKWDESVKERIYYKTVDRIMKENEKGIKRKNFFSTLSLALASMFLVISIVLNAPSADKAEEKLSAEAEAAFSEYEQEFIEKYGDLLSFSDTDTDFDLDNF